jgi:predicted outer membrane lipoprotein
MSLPVAAAESTINTFALEHSQSKKKSVK